MCSKLNGGTLSCKEAVENHLFITLFIDVTNLKILQQ